MAMIKLDKSKITKSFASGDVLAPFLDMAIKKYGDDPWEFKYTTKEHDDAWHPSGHCTPLVSELYDYVREDHSRNVSGSLQKSFMVGHFWHQWIQHIVLHKLEFCEPRAIELVGMRFWNSPKGIPEHQWWSPTKPKSGDIIVSNPYQWVRGSGDIAPLITPQWRGLVDIKTMSSQQFKAGRLPDWAEQKYLCQLNIYMDLFGEERGMILAVNKDAPHDFREFHYVKNQTLIDSIYRKWRFVSYCIDEGHRPTTQEDIEYDLTK